MIITNSRRTASAVAVAAIMALVMTITPPITAFTTTPGHNNSSSNNSSKKHSTAPEQPPKKNTFSKPPPLPKSNNPHTILGFDNLSPASDFRLVHNAYKKLAKQYHPDAAVGPDATPQEREEASLEFARINEAYDTLKQRKDEEVLEMTVMVNGRKYTQKVTTSEEIRKKDPNRIDYEKILEYRKRYSPVKSWSDQKYNYEPRHNGDFGPRRLR